MKAVLFDLFETLVTQKYSDRPTEQSFVDKLGLNLDDVRAWWGDHARERMIGKFATYQEMLSALCGSLGAQLKVRRLRKSVVIDYGVSGNTCSAWMLKCCMYFRSFVQMAGRLGLLAMLLRTRWPIGPNARSAM